MMSSARRLFPLVFRHCQADHRLLKKGAEEESGTAIQLRESTRKTPEKEGCITRGKVWWGRLGLD